MDLETASKRLRASYEEYRKAEKGNGHEAGREWAAKDASYAELKCLKADPGVLTHWRVDDTPFDDYRQACDFWEQAVGSETMPSDEYAEGFVEGALDVLSKVKF